jgi:hypothetical protein
MTGLNVIFALSHFLGQPPIRPSIHLVSHQLVNVSIASFSTIHLTTQFSKTNPFFEGSN